MPEDTIDVGSGETVALLPAKPAPYTFNPYMPRKLFGSESGVVDEASTLTGGTPVLRRAQLIDGEVNIPSTEGVVIWADYSALPDDYPAPLEINRSAAFPNTVITSPSGQETDRHAYILYVTMSGGTVENPGALAPPYISSTAEVSYYYQGDAITATGRFLNRIDEFDLLQADGDSAGLNLSIDSASFDNISVDIGSVEALTEVTQISVTQLSIAEGTTVGGPFTTDVEWTILPPATITGLSDSTIMIGDTLTITGTYLQGVAQVWVDGVETGEQGTITSVSPTSIEVEFSNTASGLVSITSGYGQTLYVSEDSVTITGGS